MKVYKIKKTSAKGKIEYFSGFRYQMDYNAREHISIPWYSKTGKLFEKKSALERTLKTGIAFINQWEVVELNLSEVSSAKASEHLPPEFKIKQLLKLKSKKK